MKNIIIIAVFIDITERFDISQTVKQHPSPLGTNLLIIRPQQIIKKYISK